MNPFKEYDVRGIYGEDITPEFAYELARNIVMHLKCSELIVARDGRLSSDLLHEHFCKGVMDQGCSVHDIGIASTPHFYFALIKFQKPGVVITASHNPKEYNGFKIMDKELNAVSKRNGLKKIEKLMKDKNFSEPYKKGNYMEIHTKKYYIDFLRSHTTDRNISFIVDSSNGSGTIEVDYLDGVYTNCQVINQNIDGNFPNHSPDPLHKQSHIQIKNKIINSEADFGVIFDGDADRAIFFDEKGDMIRPELILTLFNITGDVLYDVRSSQSLAVHVRNQNKTAFMVKTGRSNLVADMKEKDATCGVEGSGHYFFKEFNYLDSAILAVLKLIAYIKVPLSNFIYQKNLYHHSGELNFKVKDKVNLLQKIKTSFNPNKLLELDGISMYFDNGWFNIRPSNTENLVRLNIEALTNEELSQYKQKLTEIINQFQ